ncbi:hypothetical protein FisN_17Hh240 [Fistulifera solaris]|uniref:EF-hand domain-containing protein n=1 Tax=Fistulifera solaris TaxID=1519565 RepID=A0A1Z5JH28_FISSO|nr:hypothetical protein FisN_17Hh240 [Fistulifera solaris]|eukprot:GAX13299.1 hypothetical protein FisN_17Hh240 [Fistulifera solaris]
MKRVSAIILLFLSAFSHLSNAQEAQVEPDPNSDFYQEPDRFIDFPGCFADLITADVDGDGLIKKDEYLGFIQEYSKRKCIENPALTLQQRIAFNLISCGCRAEQGAPVECCLGENAQIRTAGAIDPDRTAEQQNYLTSACRVTDETLPPFNCPPIDDEREEAPVPPLPILFTIPPPKQDDDGFPKEALWALIAAALLLLLCCCCACGYRRKIARELEEEEEKENGFEPDPEQPLAASQLRSMPPGVDEENPISPVMVAGAIPLTRGVEDESEYDEDGRKRRGGGPIGDEYDEEGRKRYGAGRIPPPEHLQPGFKLRPVPPKDPEEDPDWDHPGRVIDYPKEKDDMSAQELERYVPEGGVFIPERPGKDPVEFNPQWERGQKPEEDDRDGRKHRLQSGLGSGEIWDRLDDDSTSGSVRSFENQIDWVMNSALGVLHHTDEQGLTEIDEEPLDLRLR